MPFFWTFLKVNRAKTASAIRGLKKLPKKSPNPGIKVYYVANVFGEWDNCVWFEADNHDYAMDFVQNKLAKIPGIVQTYTLPTTPINEYFTRRK